MADAADIIATQSAPRPDAPARKPAHEGTQAKDGKSFADVLGAEVKDVAPDEAAAPAQPASASPIVPAIRKVVAAAAASAVTEKPAVAGAEADPAAASAIAVTGAAGTGPIVSTAVPTAAAAAATEAAPLIADAGSLAKPSASKSSAPKAAGAETSIDADPAAVPTANTQSTETSALAPVVAQVATSVAIPAASAAATVSVAQPVVSAEAPPAVSAESKAAGAVAAAIAAPAAAIAAPAAEPVQQVSGAAPGERRAADRIDAAIAPDVSAASVKPTSHAAASAMNPTAAAANATLRQGDAPALPPSPAAARMADLKIDAAAASSTASTSAVDALNARGGAGQPAQAAASHPALQSAPTAAIQVYTRFVERFDGRAQRFEVSLEPAELGRVDVRIEVGADKKVHAILAAHDSAALSDLMRGQRSLEKALNDAGVDLADNGLRFELSDNSGRNMSHQQNDGARTPNDLAHAWRGFSPVDVPVELSVADRALASRSFARRSARLDLVA